MNDFTLLTRPDLCNHVWPSGPLLFYNYISNVSIYISSFARISVSETHILQTAPTRSHGAPLGCSICLTPILFSGFCTSNPAKHTARLHPLPRLFFFLHFFPPVCLIAYFIQRFAFVTPQHSASAAHYVLTVGFFFFLYFTLPPQHL